MELLAEDARSAERLMENWSAFEHVNRHRRAIRDETEEGCTAGDAGADMPG